MINAQTAELNVSEELVALDDAELQSIVGGKLSAVVGTLSGVTSALAETVDSVGGVTDALVPTVEALEAGGLVGGLLGGLFGI